MVGEGYDVDSVMCSRRGCVGTIRTLLTLVPYKVSTSDRVGETMLSTPFAH